MMRRSPLWSDTRRPGMWATRGAGWRLMALKATLLRLVGSVPYLSSSNNSCCQKRGQDGRCRMEGSHRHLDGHIRLHENLYDRVSPSLIDESRTRRRTRRPCNGETKLVKVIWTMLDSSSAQMS